MSFRAFFRFSKKERILFCGLIFLFIAGYCLQNHLWSSRIDILGNQPLSLSQASREQLMELPRIGPQKARQLIDLRTRMGTLPPVDSLNQYLRLSRTEIKILKKLTRP